MKALKYNQDATNEELERYLLFLPKVYAWTTAIVVIVLIMHIQGMLSLWLHPYLMLFYALYVLSTVAAAILYTSLKKLLRSEREQA